MLQKSLNKRIIGLILRQKSVRVSLLLSAILLVVSMVLFGIGYSFQGKIDENNGQITDIQSQLSALQMAANEPTPEIEDDKMMERTLAPYDQIVPFISFLESLFAIIDKESKITIRDEENEIMINRYADYEVTLKPGEKMELFLKALDGLYQSKYLTKITALEVNYTPPAEDGSASKVDNVNLTVRLYFE